MTTIQDRIIKDFIDRFGETRLISKPDGTTQEKIFIPREQEQFLIQSIKEVEEETRKEIIKNINTHKTLVAVADGNKYFEVMSIGNIIVKPIKNICNGASYKQVIYDESISITNKEKQ